MPEYENLDYGSPDGSRWGETSTKNLAMWGGTPSSRPTHANQAAVTTTQTAVTTTATVSTAGIFGFTTSTQANDIVTQLNAAQTDIRAIRAALRTAGILN